MNSEPPDKGAPTRLRPPNDNLLVGDRLAIPGHEVCSDAPHAQVRSVNEPRRAILGVNPDGGGKRTTRWLGIGGAVLEPKKVARSLNVLDGGRGAESCLRPTESSHPAGEPRELPDGVEGRDLVLSAGLHHEIAPRNRRLQLVAGEWGRVPMSIGPRKLGLTGADSPTLATRAARNLFTALDTGVARGGVTGSRHIPLGQMDP